MRNTPSGGTRAVRHRDFPPQVGAWVVSWLKPVVACTIVFLCGSKIMLASCLCEGIGTHHLNGSMGLRDSGTRRTQMEYASYWRVHRMPKLQRQARLDNIHLVTSYCRHDGTRMKETCPGEGSLSGRPSLYGPKHAATESFAFRAGLATRHPRGQWSHLARQPRAHPTLDAACWRRRKAHAKPVGLTHSYRTPYASQTIPVPTSGGLLRSCHR